MENPLTHYYAWRNNEHRAALLYGRPCFVVCSGSKNTVLVEFTDGRAPLRTTTSRRALRKTPPPLRKTPLPERLL